MPFQKKILVDPIPVVTVVSARKSVEASPATALWDSKDLLARVRNLILSSQQLNISSQTRFKN